MGNIRRPKFAQAPLWGRTGLFLSLLICGMFSFLASRPLSASDAPPRLSAARRLFAGAAPAAWADFVPDEEGNLWCSDVSRNAVVKLGPDGRVKRVADGPPFFPHRLEGPRSFSLWGSLLAVEDFNRRIYVVDLLKGRTVRTLPSVLPGDVHTNPSAGFALWKNRILFLAPGFQGAPPPFQRPAEVLTLFSTDLEGLDLKILRRETWPAAERPGRLYFGQGFSVFLPNGGAAVCSQLPARVVLLSPKGEVLREELVEDIPVPSISLEALSASDPALEFETLARTPHVVGLLSVGRWIVLVLQRPSPNGPRLFLRWLSPSLESLKEEEFPLPEALSAWDIVARVAFAPPSGVLVLVRRHSPSGDFQSRLFRSDIQW